MVYRQAGGGGGGGGMEVVEFSPSRNFPILDPSQLTGDGGCGCQLLREFGQAVGRVTGLYQRIRCSVKVMNVALLCLPRG